MSGKLIEQDQDALLLLLRIGDVQSIDKIVAKQTLEPWNPWILESSSPTNLEKNHL